MADTSKLYVTYEGGNSGVLQSNLDGSDIIDLAGVRNNTLPPNSVAIDSQHAKMYLACTQGAIFSANLDGSGVKWVMRQTNIDCGGIAVDPTAGYIYWTTSDSHGDHLIKRANLDGSSPITLLSNGLSGPNQISLDPVHGKMYWSDFNLGTVQMANLDGSNMQTLAGLAGGRGIAVDPYDGKLYWTSGNNGIWEANLDGTGKQQIISNPSLHYASSIALDVPDGKLFFTDSVTEHSVWQANLDGTHLVQLPGNYSAAQIPYGVAVYLAPVPEPSTVVLLSISAISLLAYAWQRRTRTA
jgi:DNA-binding beta-propeller fold protein YncE